jgi:hypothetical protein
VLTILFKEKRERKGERKGKNRREKGKIKGGGREFTKFNWKGKRAAHKNSIPFYDFLWEEKKGGEKIYRIFTPDFKTNL